MIIPVIALYNYCEKEWSWLQVPRSIYHMSCSLIWGQAVRLSEETGIFEMSSLLGPKTQSESPCVYLFPLSFLVSLYGLSHKEWTLLFSLGAALKWKHQNKDMNIVQTTLFLELYLNCSSLASSSHRSKTSGGDTNQRPSPYVTRLCGLPCRCTQRLYFSPLRMSQVVKLDEEIVLADTCVQNRT